MPGSQADTQHKSNRGNYVRFMAMIATSTVVMFGLMYLNTFNVDHVFWSETRFWMAFVMGAAMMVVMLLFMWSMYKNALKNWIILGVAVVVFSLGLWLVRSQVTVNDEEYMSAMIPHHSIAVMTSERAQITDPRVRKLADSIIEAQVKEIAEMKLLLEDIEKNGEIGDRTPLPARTTKLTPELLQEAEEAVERPVTPDRRHIRAVFSQQSCDRRKHLHSQCLAMPGIVGLLTTKRIAEIVRVRLQCTKRVRQCRMVPGLGHGQRIGPS